jgi:hypothetical protein
MNGFLEYLEKSFGLMERLTEVPDEDREQIEAINGLISSGKRFLRRSFTYVFYRS